jgi:hypothetical protein
MQGLGIHAHPADAGDQSQLRAQGGSMSLQDFQVHLPEADLLVLGPHQQNARRFCPRHAVSHRDKVIVRFKRDDLGFHRRGL